MSASTPPPVSDLSRRDSIAALIRAAQTGSREALGELLETSRKYLLMSANRALDADLRPKVGASDLVQDTFAHVQIDFGKFRGTTEEELFAWLVAILNHRLANFTRDYRGTQKRDIGREIPLEGSGEFVNELRDRHPTPGTATIAREEQRRVEWALAQLPSALREILIERNWRRDSFAEIGARRGRSAEAARKLWSRALRRLEKVLSEFV